MLCQLRGNFHIRIFSKEIASYMCVPPMLAEVSPGGTTPFLNTLWWSSDCQMQSHRLEKVNLSRSDFLITAAACLMWCDDLINLSLISRDSISLTCQMQEQYWKFWAVLQGTSKIGNEYLSFPDESKADLQNNVSDALSGAACTNMRPKGIKFMGL